MIDDRHRRWALAHDKGIFLMWTDYVDRNYADPDFITFDEALTKAAANCDTYGKIAGEQHDNWERFWTIIWNMIEEKAIECGHYE